MTADNTKPTNSSVEKNKGGRPKGATNKANRELKELAQSYTDVAVERLVQIIKSKKAPMATLGAISILFDRAYGKPSQAITGVKGAPPILHEVRRTIVDSLTPKDE